MNITFLIDTVKLSLKSIKLNKLRSMLTVLGIIFGTGSVISMMSISEGARREALEQIEKLGSKNIIIVSKKPPESNVVSTKQQGYISEYGITAVDLKMIQNTLGEISTAVPVRDVKKTILYKSRNFNGRILATLPEFKDISKMTLKQGRFLSAMDQYSSRKVCVIGSEVKKQLFSFSECLGRKIKLGGSYFTVVGLLESSKSVKSEITLLSHDINNDIFVPLSTAHLVFGSIIFKRKTGSFEAEKVAFHEIFVTIKDVNSVYNASKIIEDILDRHHKKKDFEIIVPLNLLYQREKTQRTFNIIMISIASISLLVGGIGIMNIMLATVTERTREIGIRRAIGATKQDIIFQFLIEAMVLSGNGGIIGIILGITGAFIVSNLSGWLTILLPSSIILCFIISFSVGIIFGLYPAVKAADMSPVEALRYE